MTNRKTKVSVVKEVQIKAVRKDKNSVITHLKYNVITEDGKLSEHDNTKSGLIKYLNDNSVKDKLYGTKNNTKNKLYVVKDKYIRDSPDNKESDNLVNYPPF